MPAPATTPRPARRRPLVRLLAVFLALAVLMLVPFLIWGDSLERSVTRESIVAGLGDAALYAWIAGLALLLSDLLLPVPNTVIMAALGVVYGPLLGGLVASAGVALSGAVGYGVCRAWGRPAARRLVGEDGLAEGERLFARAGGGLVAVTRPVPILSEVIACMAGLAGMRARVFLAALLCGSLPLGFLMAGLGYAGSERPLLTLIVGAALPLPLWLAVERLRVVRGGNGA